jgi:hypothetical protein
MIKSENGTVEIIGEMSTVMADFGIIVAKLVLNTEFMENLKNVDLGNISLCDEIKATKNFLIDVEPIIREKFEVFKITKGEDQND